MKKALLVLALATALIFVFAGVAFAWTPTPTYVAWDGSGVNSNGPHADYQTGTTKCAVCHSVHIAPQASYVGTTGGVPWTAGSKTELLLRSTVADSCRYCHIDTAVGGVQLYGGASGVYGTWTGPGHKGSSNSACTNCHAVHGANTYKGDNTPKILRIAVNDHGAPGAPQTEILGGSGATAGLFVDQAAATNAPGRKYEQQTVFCSQCHENFSRSADTSLTSGFKSHSMVAAPSASFSATSGGIATQYDATGADNSVGATTTNNGVTISGIQVAASGSGTCRACHTAGGVNQTGVSWNSFPHYTRGMPYFLNDGQADTSGSTGNTGTPTDPSHDGNCKMCHTNVGSTF